LKCQNSQNFEKSFNSLNKLLAVSDSRELTKQDNFFSFSPLFLWAGWLEGSLKKLQNLLAMFCVCLSLCSFVFIRLSFL
jgi:hypothetical protein